MVERLEGGRRYSIGFWCRKCGWSGQHELIGVASVRVPLTFQQRLSMGMPSEAEHAAHVLHVSGQSAAIQEELDQKASINVLVSNLLIRCPSCARRSLVAWPLASLIALPKAALFTVVATIVSMLFMSKQSQMLPTAVVFALLSIAFFAHRRVRAADAAIVAPDA